ncbi:MAG: DNA-processing protein DprA [Usitatibacter sp.]
MPWLRLALVPGVSPLAQRALLDEYKTPQAVLAAPMRDIEARAGRSVALALARGPIEDLVERTRRWCEDPDHHVLALADARYPKALRAIADPPPVLYARGRVDLLDAPSIAIVGSRNATAQGQRDAEAFARELSSAGLCIVSGMALGIDAAAHRGGLAAMGSSVAVLGTGIDIVYPRGNRDLAHSLAATGCLVSEFPLGTPSLSGNFPRRNRLISGLARGVLVVEAGKPSGSLITARFALEQGREVFAIPGSIHSALSKGCNDLIKQGARLVEEANEILEELRWGTRLAPRAEPDADAPDPFLESMGFAPTSPDQIAQRTGIAAKSVAAQLSLLEIEGRIASLPGGLFQRVQR